MLTEIDNKSENDEIKAETLDATNRISKSNAAMAYGAKGKNRAAVGK